MAVRSRVRGTRLTPATDRRVELAAAVRGESVSAYLARAAREATERDLAKATEEAVDDREGRHE